MVKVNVILRKKLEELGEMENIIKSVEKIIDVVLENKIKSFVDKEDLKREKNGDKLIDMEKGEEEKIGKILKKWIERERFKEKENEEERLKKE